MHLLPLNTEAVYLDLTFITLAMLVIGGATSLWGAVVGALAVSALDSYLAIAENGTTIFGRPIDLPAGTRVIVVGALMALVLILRPHGDHGRPRVQALAEGERMTRVCVAGAGVIGSLFAAHLARVAEVSALVAPRGARPRAARAGSARQRPRRLHGAVAGGDRTGGAARAGARDPRLQGHRPRRGRRRIAGHWPDAIVMTVQNGIGADEVVARHGDWPLLSAPSRS